MIERHNEWPANLKRENFMEARNQFFIVPADPKAEMKTAWYLLMLVDERQRHETEESPSQKTYPDRQT